ncbi:MAG: diphosphate--fructose-6-phosphate 1-phosphotransferase [Angelakisella sp.]
MVSNLLIAHGGAPTAVINASLYGAVTEAKKYTTISNIYGAIHGTAGILAEEFVTLSEVPQRLLNLLPHTPASAIGTSRTPLTDNDYVAMAHILKKHDIKYLLFTGGNGSMDTCGKLYQACKGQELFVAGIPKTIDNDIAVIDHAPGFGSAARFVVQSVREAAQDVQAMPIHVSVIEVMGRNAGWLTAASALARKQPGDAPHILCLPEHPFDEDAFLAQVKELYARLGGVVVVASEGLRNKAGKPIVPPIFTVGRATYYGDVSAYLAELIIKKLGIKARSEKPGLLGRCSAAHQSSVDRAEAIELGAAAVRAVMEGRCGVMAGLKRISSSPYRCETVLVPIEQVMLEERTLPAEFITQDGGNVTEQFVEWCRPLLGEELPEFVSFLPNRDNAIQNG